MNETIMVALSGGVDSSTAAALLKKQGHTLIAVTMRICSCDDTADALSRGCYGPGSQKRINDACLVAQSLDIPFHVIDLCHEFRNEVLSRVATDYMGGLTPNPCIYCNQRVKFGALIEHAERIGLRFDRMATGHYANLTYDANHRFLLKKALDLKKDQSYFLSFLNQGQLSRTLFPLGSYHKQQVRLLASEWGLPVANKPESQDFVFGGYRSLLPEAEEKGPIVDANGKQVGIHDGIAYYTIGQRKGLKLSLAGKYYVTSIIPERNTIVVGLERELYKSRMIVRRLNWIALDNPKEAFCAEVKIRSGASLFPGVVEPIDDGVGVVFNSPQRSITPGQVAVFYSGDIVIGAGVIARDTE